jgi:CRP/FNR family transcriptional regulator, cyclic AMP receptor protein
LNNRRYLCLHDIPLFSGLSMESFRQICLTTNKQQLPKGQSLFRQGDVSDRVYVIKEGCFKLLRMTSDGNETILEFVGPGEIIGETALFRSDKVHLATAISMAESKVCSIDHDTFEKIIKAQPNLAWELIRNLGDRLYGVWEQVSEANGQTTLEKVLSLMLRMAHEHGEVCAEGTRITIPFTQQEIAALVGASRVMVAQSIKELTMRNYLCREKRHYILKNRCF